MALTKNTHLESLFVRGDGKGGIQGAHVEYLEIVMDGDEELARTLAHSTRDVPHPRDSYRLLGELGATIDLLKVGETGAIHLEGSIGCYALTAAPGPLSVISTVSIGYRP